MVQGVVFQSCRKGLVVDTMVTIEALILCIDEGFPENWVHLLVSHWRAVLAEELTDGLAVGTVDDGGLGRTLVLDGRHRGRLTEEP